MDFTEINSRGKRGELLGRIDRQISRFRTAKTIIIKFGLHASFVEAESAKNALNEGHLTLRALDWFDVLGYKVVEDKATDYAHLKQALTEQFPVVRNRSELETRFYASYQNHNQKSSDFVYEFLKIHKQLKLDMREEKLLDHVISRLEPQLLDYVEVRYPQTTSNLLQIIDKQENWRETRVNNRYSDNSRPQREFNRFEGQGVEDIWRFDSRRRSGQSDHIDSIIKAVDRVVRRTVLSGVRVVKTALWDTGAEKSLISEEVYRRYFSYRPRQKTKDRVVTAQGALCCHLGRVELQIRIQDFQKTWEFHIRNNMQYQCILGIDFIRESKLTLDFDKKSLIIPDDQIKQLPIVEKPVEIHLSDTKLDIGDQGPVVSRPYRYDRVKQGKYNIDYNIEKMLQEGKIQPIQSPYASPVFLMGKNNGLPPDSPEAYRFAIDYRKLNAITKYPRYPLPVIDDLITNIPLTVIILTLDLKSGYFQLALNPKDIEKTAFITQNGIFAFLRMPFGLSGVAPNFQKAIVIILKQVFGRFVMCYMDDVIITSPSFNEHLDHLNQVFTLLLDAGLTLDKDKCHFARDKLKHLGLIISKDGIETDNNKGKAITKMKAPKNNKEC
ncbi:retrovirus-related Pol polyprotein from transposon 297 [Trichonephila clavipes]|uniref:Retrovirus-related Pol polyprotein from transposon 297 n=1 Tax=Trichonephila clavipes TaxID=2585209 RepID=A0A8X6VQB0_TRICX|nr:retrovirus-related Pol polyprotein from transposon 297 [Trichonephila clavipes]